MKGNGRIDLWETGAKFAPDSSIEELQKFADGFVRNAAIMSRSVPWIVGDFVNFARRRWPEVYAQLLDSTAYNEKSLNLWCGLCRRIHPSVRRMDISITHHLLVAGKPKHVQRKVLAHAAKENLTVREMREYMVENFPSGSKAGRPRKKMTFDEWIEQYCEENGYTTNPNADGVKISDEIVRMLNDAFTAGGRYS